MVAVYMKNLFLALIFCIFTGLAATSDVVAANPCAGLHPAPQLKFNIAYGKLRYDMSYSRDQLAELAAYYNLREKGMFTAGLSVSDINGQVRLHTVTERVGEIICVIPVTVELNLGYRRPTIYIVNDLAPESCEYNTVMRHEQQHQQISVMALEHFVPQIRRQMAAKMTAVKPRAVSSEAEADAEIAAMNEEYWDLFMPMIDRFRDSLLHEQHKLDSRQNYEFESRLCRK